MDHLIYLYLLSNDIHNNNTDNNFQGLLATIQGKLRFKTALRTDFRVKLMNEITTGIQVIKMYAWEKPFQKVVEEARK